MVQSQSLNLDESRQEPDDKTYPKGRSEFAKQAQKLSGKSVNGYWTRPTEMFARAFESWAFDKVTAMGARSDYLVHGVEEDRFAGGHYKGNPYPTGEERAMINAALDNLAKTIQTKETDKGVAMFSRGTNGKSLPVSQVQSMVEAIRAQWTNAPEVVVVASMDDSAIPKSVRDYDQQQRSVGASGSPEGFVHGGKAYLVADQLATPTDAMRVLFHETLGHMGLRGVFGDSLKPTLARYGLMDRASLSAWGNAYQHYVPLHRDEARPETGSHPIGQGFSVKGNASKQRTGSTEKVTNILAHIAMQREAALTRGEKNHVVKKLYLMAAQNPDKDFWEVDAPPMIKTIDSRTGFVRTMVDPQFKNLPNVVMVRIAGNDQAIVFNEHNKQAKRLAEAIKNIDVGDLHVVLGLAAKGTRWFASVNTQYNPIFGLINFARDVQSGLLNLTTTPLAGKQKEVAANIPAAMRAIYRERRGKSAASVEWARLWDEYQSVGGITGYKDMFADVEDRAKALTKELDALDRGEVSKAAHAVVDWLSDYNEAMENSVRLAAYKQALDQGISKERAASLAKNLTVNFNRKGRQAREIGALYAFFNASIQGTARMAETLKGPVGKRIMYGGVLLGVVNTLIGMAMMGGDDDDAWEKIPEFIKERSIVIPIGSQDYLTIPMPLGFHVFPNIGRIATEFALGGQDKTLGRQLGKLLMATMDSFNPLGGSQNVGQLVAPTVIDPVVALMENKDWTGRPIYRENANGLDQQPGHTMAKDSASSPSRFIAKQVNRITGGTDYRPGAWSPTPDQLDYVIGQLTGGLGRELLKANQTVVATATGDELPPYKVPLLGRLYGNTRGPSGQSGQYYANIKELNEIENEVKGRLRNSGDVDSYRKSEPLSELVQRGNVVERHITQIRKVRRMVVEKAEPGYQERVKELDKRIGDAMAELNREVTKARRKAAAQ